jgi:hypothetical protein
MAAGVRTDGFIDPCIPTLAAKPPADSDWVHEIKHDGYRLIVPGRARQHSSSPAAATTGSIAIRQSLAQRPSCGRDRSRSTARRW